ncbi:MAG TPA: glycosyltransferase family 39 protein, partial [bacterium]|nr:glycosyltransferase family 39 protein [bacterium]
SYFFSKSHPLPQVFPFLGKLLDTGSFPSSSTSQFWTIQGESLRILFTVFCVSGATWALGRNVRRWLALDLTDPWVKFAFDFGLGICFLGLFWVGTGLAGLWYKPVWMAAAVPFLLLFAWEMLKVFQGGIPRRVPNGAGYIFLFIAGLFYWAFSILQNLAPETFYDSMVYHLAVPQYWLFHHGLADFPTNFFSNYPYGAEAYFLNGLVWQGTESAKMLHAVCAGVCAIAAGGWARETGGDKAGWLALGFTLTLPLLAVNSWATEVEGFQTLAVVLFVYALYRFAVEKEKNLVWALVTGLFAGLALSTKYTSVLAVGGAILVLVFQRPGILKVEKWRHWLVAALAALLLLGPWILKNLVFTGNPFFPYLMSHFPGRHLLPDGYERLLQEQHARVTTDGWSWLLLPWTLTMANPDSYNFCGPLALALVPTLFLFRLRHPVLRFLAALTLILLISGFAVTHILRFVLPVFVLFSVLAAVVLGAGDKPGWGKGWAWTAGFCGLFCFAYLSAISNYYYSCAGIWAGRETRAEYLTSPGKITPYYGMAEWVNSTLPPDARLLVVGDARGLYYGRPFLTDSVFDEQVLSKAAKEEAAPEGIVRRLKKLGVDYLVVNGMEGVRVSADYRHYDLTTEQWKRLDTFVQQDTELVYQQNLQGVYRIGPVSPEPRPETFDLVLFFS